MATRNHRITLMERLYFGYTFPYRRRTRARKRERDNLITACGRFSFRFIQRRAAERHVENCVVPPPEMVLCESSLVPWPLITRTHTHVRKFPRARLWHRHSLAKRMHAIRAEHKKCLITTHLHPGSSLLAASARSALNL